MIYQLCTFSSHKVSPHVHSHGPVCRTSYCRTPLCSSCPVSHCLHAIRFLGPPKSADRRPFASHALVLSLFFELLCTYRWTTCSLLMHFDVVLFFFSILRGSIDASPACLFYGLILILAFTLMIYGILIRVMFSWQPYIGYFEFILIRRFVIISVWRCIRLYQWLC